MFLFLESFACVSSFLGNSLFACSSLGTSCLRAGRGLQSRILVSWRVPERVLILGAIPRTALPKPSKCFLPTRNKNLKQSFALSNECRFFQNHFPIQNSCIFCIEILDKVENSFKTISIVFSWRRKEESYQLCL